jgi:Ca2+-binding RTX toxin-like protein
LSAPAPRVHPEAGSAPGGQRPDRAIGGNRGNIVAVINGTAGNDTLEDTAGNDVIDGMDGDDIITVTAGNDEVWGGAGSDILILDYRASLLAVLNHSGPAANGTLGGWNGAFTNYNDRYVAYNSIEHFHIRTGSGHDNITTADGNDVVLTGDGDDRVDVGSGNDTADGGDGVDGIAADLRGASGAILWDLAGNSYSGPIGSFSNFEYFIRLQTGSGDDVVVTTDHARSDLIYLGAGNDRAEVRNGSDEVWGGSGSDTLVIAWGASVLAVSNQYGPAANAELGGWDGVFTNYNDRYVAYTSIEHFHITTGSGNDVITTADGDDVVVTGAGDDRVDVGSGDDRADGGEGIDGIAADLRGAGGAILWNLADDSYSGPIGGFSNFEYFTQLRTGGGDDVIVTTAHQRNDLIFLGDGNDSAEVRNGSDEVWGGSGSDTLVIDYSATDAAVFTQFGPVANAGLGGWDGAFTNYGDRYVAYNSIEHFRITTGSGNDNIITADGNDVVHGGAGDDLIDVGSGIDQADGGAGIDRISADMSAFSAAVLWNLETNSYAGPAGSQFANFEYFGTLRTGSGDDVIVTTAERHNETIHAGAGNDRITVKNGDDQVHGGAGSDTLIIDYSGSGHFVSNRTGPSGSLAEGYSGEYWDQVGRYVYFTGIEHFHITGSAGGDRITTAGGDDIVLGGDGADWIDVGSGTDQAHGGAGIDGISADMSAYQGDIGWNLAVDSYSGPAGTAFSGFEYFGVLRTGAGHDTIVTTDHAQNDIVHAGAGDDHVAVFNGSDEVHGGAGSDTLAIDYSGSTHFVSTRSGPSGSLATGYSGEYWDQVGRYVYYTGIEHFHITGSAGGDHILTGAGDDIVHGGGGNDWIDVGSGTDQAHGGDGMDGISADMSGASVAIAWNLQTGAYSGPAGTAYSGFEYFGTLRTGSGDDVIVTSAHASNDIVHTGSGNDRITVVNGSDEVHGGAGSDTLVIDYSGSGHFVSNRSGPSGSVAAGYSGEFWDQVGRYVYYSGIEHFHITGSNGNDVLATGDGHDIVRGGAGNDTIATGGGNDLVEGGDGDDQLDGGTGNDTLSYQAASAGVTVSLAQTGPQATGGAGTDTISNFENLLGSAFADSLTGNFLANRINGGAGADAMAGGLGADVYVVDDAGDVVTESAGGGIDTVVTAVSWTLGAHVENLVAAAGAGSLVLGGNGHDNRIVGGGANDVLSGGAGNDLLVGGAGSDLLDGGEGNDLLVAAAIGANLVVNGSFETQNGSNDARAWILGLEQGGSVTDRSVYNGVPYAITADGIFGWTRIGGGTLELNTQGSNPDFAPAHGNAALDMEADPGEVAAIYQDIAGLVAGEQLVLSFTAARPTGGPADPNPSGLLEVLWNDRVVATVTPTSLEGTQFSLLVTASSVTTGANGANRLTFREVGTGEDARGTILDAISLHRVSSDGSTNLLIGGSGNDVLLGGTASDTLDGGDGDDILFGNGGGGGLDGGAGRDLLVAGALGGELIVNGGFETQDGSNRSRDFVASGGTSGSNVQTRSASELAGWQSETGAFRLAGNDGGATFPATDGAVLLDMENAAGENNGIFQDIAGLTAGTRLLLSFSAARFAHAGGDAVLEVFWNDVLVATITSTGTTPVVHYVDLRAAEAGTGAGGANRLLLREKGAIDGSGTALDAVSLRPVLSDTAAVSLFGGDGDDVLVGSDGPTIFVGGAGADLMIGGLGNDVYVVDDEGDVVRERPGEGIDRVETSLSRYTLGANLENLSYTGAGAFTGTGNALDNTIVGGNGDDVLRGEGGDDLLSGGDGDDQLFGGSGRDVLGGGAGNDLLDGGEGADQMAGGQGDDTYIVDDIGDTVTEEAGEGIDTVRTSLAGYALTAHVENLVGTSAAGQALTGNALGNVISGGDGNDVIDGGGGADTMIGGLGDDSYFVDDENDLVVEDADGGYDTVTTALSTYVLPANVERLIYTGTAPLTVTGNQGDNVINGSAGADLFLLQQGGEDTVSAGAGNDGFYLGAELSQGDQLDGGEGVDQVAIQGNYGTFGPDEAPFTLGAGNLVDIEVLNLLSGSDTRFGDSGGNSYSYNLKLVDANVAAGRLLRINWSQLGAGEDVTLDASEETDGSFFVLGGAGVDRITFGAGNDAAYFSTGRFSATDRIDGGAGYDEVALRGDYTLAFEADTITNVEFLGFLSASDLRFNGPAAAGFNYDITMHDGNVAAGETLRVWAAQLMANESLVFNGSAETTGRFHILAGRGDDQLIGGGGDDIIYGGLGGDIMTGNGGDDTFLYRSIEESRAGSADFIINLEAGDRIDLGAIDADVNTAGNQAFTFIGDAAFSNTAGELRLFSAGGGFWRIQADVDGDGVADMEIWLDQANEYIPTVDNFVL